jgi:hypothetical protein
LRSIEEGASEAKVPTSSAEDRKAAVALSALDAYDDAVAGKQEMEA